MDLRLGERTFGPHDMLIMAIVNRTPDSFYDRGASYSDSAAQDRVAEVVEQGAHIVDIGGVKAGPGDAVSTEEELRRTVSFVEWVRSHYPDVIVSVDTWRAAVGRAVCDAGAHLLNDAWGGWDPGLAEVAATYQVGLVCTHAGGLPPRTRPHRVDYTDPTGEVVATVTKLADRAVRLGVPRESVVIDPGHDFGKNTYHSLRITAELERLAETGWPVLVSLSNKDFVGETLNRPVGERLIGTLAATSLSAWLGARVFRVHNVVETADTLHMVAAIRGDLPPRVARRGLA